MAGRLELARVLRLTAREYVRLLPRLLVTAAIVFLLLDPVNGALWLVATDPVAAAVTTVITIAGSYYYDGVVALLVGHDVADRRPPLRQIFKEVPTLRLAAVDLILLVVGSVALALGVVPGLVLAALWLVAAPVVVLERSGVVEALRRSRQLVRGNVPTVLLLLVFTFPVYAAAVLGLGWLGIVLAGENVWGYFLGAFLGNVAFAPLASVAVAAVYLELRRLENA